MGVAHHAAYAPWLEIARTELLRESGVTYADLERAGVFLVITRLECKYRRPVHYDDLIEVRTTVSGGSRVKILHEYEIALLEDSGHGLAPRTPGDIVTAASTTLVCVGRDGKVQPLPDWLAPAE
jgi:acyl-CoA thioester hydrolase